MDLPGKTRNSPEFILVGVMLGASVLLVFAVLFIFLVEVKEEDITIAKDILDFRKNVLAVIITAFEVWIGVGAAYYFGRENPLFLSRALISFVL